MFQQGTKLASKVLGAPRGKKEAINAISDLLTRTPLPYGDHGATTRHSFCDGPTKGLGASAGVNDHVEPSVDGSHLLLKADQAAMIGKPPLQEFTTKLGSGNLTGTSLVDGATNDVGTPPHAREGSDRVQKECVALPVGVRRDEADSRHFSLGWRHAGE
jgi:hypothetical protein